MKEPTPLNLDLETPKTLTERGSLAVPRTPARLDSPIMTITSGGTSVISH